jgi:hypothetical protein
MSTGQMLCTADCGLVCQLFQFDLGASIVIPAESSDVSQKLNTNRDKLEQKACSTVMEKEQVACRRLSELADNALLRSLRQVLIKVLKRRGSNPRPPA